MLHEMLSRVAKEFVYERAKAFGQSEFGSFVRKDLAEEAKRRLVFLPYDLKVKGSVGAGVWAAVPWLAFFDPLITETVTKGFYVVYLINPKTEEIFLSLNQGATAVYNEFGRARGREVLARRDEDLANRIPSFASLFSRDPIDLGSDTDLPIGYMAGHAFGRSYHADTINVSQFDEDLANMLIAYEALIDAGGLTPSDIMQEESGSTDIEETRKYTLSRRIERAPNVRRKVLERRGAVCEGCSLDPKLHLSFEGPIRFAPLDVHHSKPIHQLAEGESRRYKIPDDFLVLCPTCHRMIHKQHDPTDVMALRQSIRFTRKLKI